MLESKKKMSYYFQGGKHFFVLFFLSYLQRKNGGTVEEGPHVRQYEQETGTVSKEERSACFLQNPSDKDQRRRKS